MHKASFRALLLAVAAVPVVALHRRVHHAAVEAHPLVPVVPPLYSAPDASAVTPAAVTARGPALLTTMV